MADSIQLVAASADGVWVVDQFAGAVVRIDPESLRTVGDPVPFTGSIDAIAVMGDHVWVLDFGTGLLTRISIRQNRVVGQVAVPARPTSLAAGLGAIWVSHADGTITKVDPDHRAGIAPHPAPGGASGDRRRRGEGQRLG